MKAFSTGLPGRMKLSWTAPPIDPIFERPGLEFRAVIHRDGARAQTLAEHTIKYLAHGLARQSEIRPL
jgi:hypothetical protein